MIYDPFKSTSFFVRESLLNIEKSNTSFLIGIPKETIATEKRLALTPEAVAILVDSGHRVMIESTAGQSINYSDQQYSEAGAIIADSPKRVFQADIIIKIGTPTAEQVAMMRPRTTIISFLQLQTLTKATLELMTKKRINAMAYELICDEAGISPFITAISEIEGITAITLAAELMSNANGGKGILLGGIPGISPTEIVILGANTAGFVAARAALALGATVKMFDDDIAKLRSAQQTLGRSFFTSTLHPNVLRNTFRSADVVIGAMHCVGQTHRYIISADLVSELKKGAIIIDLRMAYGGCFETTAEACLPESPQIFDKMGVLHFCETNISSRVARTASMAVSNVLSEMFPLITDCGGVDNLAKMNRRFAAGFYMFAGKMVNTYVGSRFNYPASDIGLFLSSGF